MKLPGTMSARMPFTTTMLTTSLTTATYGVEIERDNI
jgi:hypothetical protein